ncbi:28S ribosomal protein S36, mitochondrial isoform X2 [Brienomyrus brachyistius]|uniref:28S ribosomal protein S36, mitochondrial isoform X2 n=1 Tax=Brienomyrus brachyistius TaxID=42636 RepID=UPI0020B37E5D|nr:28S ribosomal protein S36, mitochondrial isoform X2 [Brienomyrus brachyistius]
MGSKISGKMAAASRVVQVVKPHAPLIKFPNRQNIPRPNGTSPSTHSSVPSAALGSRPPGAASPVPGTPDSATTVRDFPQRYRRKPLAIDEMDYIQRGGPE